MLERAVERMTSGRMSLRWTPRHVGRIVATVEGRREAELEQKLAAAEAQIAELQALRVLLCLLRLHMGGRHFRWRW